MISGQDIIDVLGDFGLSPIEITRAVQSKEEFRQAIQEIIEYWQRESWRGSA
jgi:hypothetical protein